MPAPQTLLLGAAGFIGQHIAIALREAGYNVLACARDTRRLTAMGFDTLAADLADPATHSPDFWRPHVENCSRVINCAGLLTGRDADFHAVHVAAPQAVYAALPATARGVLISAVGIKADTPFATYRRRGEEIAKSAPIPVTILRPGLELADGSYGGSSLARALAALPIITPVVGSGDQTFNPIHADDLAALVIEALGRRPPDQPIEIGGPEQITQTDLLTSLRAWLGLRSTRILHLPLPLARLTGRIGDTLRLAPILATSVQQLEQGVATDTTEQDRYFKTRPRGFATFLLARPSQTQDLWHARLYLLRPILRLTLALMWLVSGLIGLLLPADSFLPYVSGLLPDTMLVAAARLCGAGLGVLADGQPA